MKRVYDMSFAEFQIRLFAWRRCQDREWEKVRTLAWHIEASSIHRSKKMPAMNKFMPLSIDKEGISSLQITDIQKNALLQATSEYLKNSK